MANEGDEEGRTYFNMQGQNVYGDQYAADSIHYHQSSINPDAVADGLALDRQRREYERSVQQVQRDTESFLQRKHMEQLHAESRSKVGKGCLIAAVLFFAIPILLNIIIAIVYNLNK